MFLNNCKSSQKHFDFFSFFFSDSFSILADRSPSRVYYFTRYLRSYRPPLSLHLVPPLDKWCCSVQPSPSSFEKVLSTRTRRAPSATLHNDSFVPAFQKVRFIFYHKFLAESHSPDNDPDRFLVFTKTISKNNSTD